VIGESLVHLYRFPLERVVVPSRTDSHQRFSVDQPASLYGLDFNFRGLCITACSCMGLRLARSPSPWTVGDLFLDCEEATGGL